MSSSTLTYVGSATSLSKRLGLAIGASLLGALLVCFTGFSHIDAIRDAIRNIRRNSGFPCH